MNKVAISTGLKSFIWVCLGVIFFSVLFVFSGLFFPFITSKTIIFQIVVELMFVAFLLLCLFDSKYRLQLSSTVLLLGMYLLFLTVASLFSGNDFYRSFWSNNERSDGILLLTHLWLFSIVLTGFLRSLKEWLYVLDIFLVACFAVAVVALDQYLALTWPDAWSAHFIPSSNGARLASTIGNAGYVGGYMVFGFFISLFMFLKRFSLKSIWLNLWYGLVFFVSFFIAIQTQTRGAYLALGFGILVLLVYLMWFYFNYKYLKLALIAILLFGIFSLGGLFYFKDSSFVKNQSILNRISSISVSSGTAVNRLVTWEIGWRGLQERPILGYGQENFYQVFDRYYNTKNTEHWFDRCHNMFCDRAITGGSFGLLSYLALLLLPFIYLWIRYIKQESDQTEKNDNQEHWSRKFLMPVIFSILIIAYIIQNFFIFEALATYIPLIMVLSFVGLYGKNWSPQILNSEKFKKSLSIFAIVLLLPLMWLFSLYPIRANADFIKVLSSNSTNLNAKIYAFEEVLNRGTFGNQEYRRHYFSFYESVMMDYLSQTPNRNSETDQIMADFSNKMEAQLNLQIQENPNNVSNFITLMRFYNISYYFDLNRLYKAIALSDHLISLSSGRPQIYYEISSSHFYLSAYYKATGNDNGAKEELVNTIKIFHQGAEKNYYKNQAFDQLASFLLSIKFNSNGEFFASTMRESVNSELIREVLNDLTEWSKVLGEGETQDKLEERSVMLKELENWLMK